MTTADTEILAASAAVARLGDDFPDVRCANPAAVIDHDAFIDELLDGARVVLCRLLGGRRGWPDGFDRLREGCAERSIALLALGGEIESDAEMTALSTAPAGAVAQAGEYLRHGDVSNVEQLLRFLADTFLLHGHGFDPPHELPDLGVYVPGAGDVAIEEAITRHDPGRPTVGICFYRSHRITG
ncbi:MAG: cobaltochelatase subunit CobN, partial [Solirubrobacteraceae bacterium]